MIRSGRLPLWNGYAGCGTPHLANGQSAVFDPFHLLAYLGTTPGAYAWIAAGRLWMAGLGMFLLARSWGLGFWGRWFAGLDLSILRFPRPLAVIPGHVGRDLDAVAVPGDRPGISPTRGPSGWLAGHRRGTRSLRRTYSDECHVLLAGGLYTLARGFWERAPATPGASLMSWAMGTCLGLGLAAVQIVPLGFYLAKSSVWSDRRSERPAWWLIDRPRLLDAVCTAAPYVYGSQRRGHPNLARALGVHNLNESAGGHAGLATLIWLAPLAVVACRRDPRVAFLTGLVIFGVHGSVSLAAGRQPVACSCPSSTSPTTAGSRSGSRSVCRCSGGIGLDHLGQSQRLSRGWLVAWVGGGLVLGSVAVPSPVSSRSSASGPKPIIARRHSSHREPMRTFYQERALRQVARAA